jgi:hypothetical protein
MQQLMQPRLFAATEQSSSSSSSKGSAFDSVVAQHGSAGSDNAVLGRFGPAASNAGVSSSGSDPWSGSSGPTALHTADWPVLSGAREHARAKPLWWVHHNNRPPPQWHKKQQRRLASVVDEAVGGRGNAYAADSSTEHGAGSRVLVAAGNNGKAEALTDAAVLVPSEYFQVRQSGC